MGGSGSYHTWSVFCAKDIEHSLEVVILGFAWAFSTDRRAVNWRLVAWGLGIQFALALFILKLPLGRQTFQMLGDGVTKLLHFSGVGAEGRGAAAAGSNGLSADAARAGWYAWICAATTTEGTGASVGLDSGDIRPGALRPDRLTDGAVS